MNDLGKMLVFTGVLLIAAGVVFMLLDRIPFQWRVPGDIVIKRDNFTFAFPLGTCILISVALSIILSILRK